jgi:uncharacterized membrane protein YfcA
MKWAVMGLPVVAAAIASFGVAFATRYTLAGFAGALIATPLSLYLKDMPYLHWVSLAAVPANFLAATALWRKREDIAFAMLLPFMLQIALIAILWYRNFPVFTGFRF